MEENTSTSRRKASDRRVTVRLPDPRIRKTLNFVYKTVYYLGAFIMLLGVGTIATGFFRTPYETMVRLAVGTLAILFATMLLRYGRSLSLYVKNEAASNLAEAMDRQKMIWLILSIAVTVITIVAFSINT